MEEYQMKIKKIFTSLLCVILSTILMSGITAFASVINGNPTSYTGNVNGTYVYSGLNAGNTVTHKANSAPNQYIGYYKKGSMYSTETRYYYEADIEAETVQFFDSILSGSGTYTVYGWAEGNNWPQCKITGQVRYF